MTLLDDTRGRLPNMLIFPNLVVNDIMAVTVRTFMPSAPDQTDVTAWELAPRGELAQLRQRRLDSFLTFLGPAGFATPDAVEGSGTDGELPVRAAFTVWRFRNGRAVTYVGTHHYRLVVQDGQLRIRSKRAVLDMTELCPAGDLAIIL